MPIGVGQLTPETLPPRLPTVDVRTDGCRGLLGDHQSVRTPERAVNEIREVVDIVDRGKEDGIDVLAHHVGAQTPEALGHL